MQQLSKLFVAAEAASEHVVAIDSDVVVTPHATVADFVDPEGVVCFTRTGDLPTSSPNKVRHWNVQAHRLFGSEPPGDGHWRSTSTPRSCSTHRACAACRPGSRPSTAGMVAGAGPAAAAPLVGVRQLPGVPPAPPTAARRHLAR
ncbi:MAG: hypothetical protein U5K43_03130 [Halofilum sp. (in: g-proteobacteria)]|nr:hypothetical protein [Halofilum sp. (in: g-proteobacteria)]